MSDDLIGRDFLWFALDRNGDVAVCASGGEGVIPEAVGERYEQHDLVADTLQTPHWGSVQIWDDYAAYGLYVFDWKRYRGPYRRLAVPSAPMTEELRARILAIDALPRFDGAFRDLRELVLQQHR